MTEKIPDTLESGWSAPSLMDQFPMLNQDRLKMLHEDFEAFSRLYIRGYITDTVKMKMIARLRKKLLSLIKEYKKLQEAEKCTQKKSMD